MYKIGLFLLALSISLIVKSSFFQEPLLAQDSGAKQLTTKISDLDNRDSGISGKATIYSGENIRLEATVSSNFLNIPLLKEDSCKNKVEVSIRIINNSQVAKRFTMFDTIRIEIVGADGKKDIFGSFRTYTVPLKESECPLLQPGESFIYNLTLFSARDQVSDEFMLVVPDKYGGAWLIKNLTPGAYKIRFVYHNYQSESTECTFSETAVFNPLTGVIAGLKDFWTGVSPTNFFNLTLEL